MNERIKELRKVLKLTQQEFAESIKVKRNTVATYEMGRSIPSDSAIALICKTFNVNEEWLRSGAGGMFLKFPEEDETATYISLLLEDSQNPFADIVINIMKTYAELSPKSQEALQEFCQKLKKNLSTKKEED